MVALMLYTRIPVPRFEPGDDDMGHAIAFLPLPGVIIAGLMYLLLGGAARIGIPVTVRAIAAVLVPLVVTGGFHTDGFMDTTDALRSYQPKERKLEIMHDPHVGSFAVIGLVTAVLFMIAGLSLIAHISDPGGNGLIVNTCGIFVLSRAMAALTSINMKKARNDGLLRRETEDAGHTDNVILAFWLIAAFAVMVHADAAAACVVAISFAAFTLMYRHITRVNFGGVTGDTAGYYVTMSETVAVSVLAVSQAVMKIII